MASNDRNSTREDRLKAALKANMARRKQQARARRSEQTDQSDPAGAPQAPAGQTPQPGADRDGNERQD